MLPPHEVHLWVAALEGEEAGELLSPEERAVAEGYLFPVDRARYRAARTLLRRILGHYLAQEPQRVSLTRSPQGKPVLADGAAGIRFNLSHSAGFAVCAVAREREVGVDLERHRRFREPDRLAERVLSPREREGYHALAPELRESALLHCWTRKEAYLKATGEGITRPLAEVEVSLAPDQPAALLAVAGDARAAQRWSMHEPRAAPDFVCALVVERPHGGVLLRAWPPAPSG
jgi:4'-phosphopantetheinyl transferase